MDHTPLSHIDSPFKHGVRPFVGAIAIAALALVLGWFLAQIGPAEPRQAAADPTPGAFFDHPWDAPDFTDVVAIAPGASLSVDGFVHGSKFQYRDGEWDAVAAPLTADQKQAAEEDPGWCYRLEAVEITAGNGRVVSEESFREWYPAYEAATAYEDAAFDPADVRVVLAEVQIENKGTQPVDPHWLYLTSPLFRIIDEQDRFLPPDSAALSAIYGVPSPDRPFNALPEDWAVVAPGETKTLELPFIVWRTQFADQEAFDRLAGSDFAIATFNADPAVAYELALS